MVLAVIFMVVVRFQSLWLLTYLVAVFKDPAQLGQRPDGHQRAGKLVVVPMPSPA